MFAELPRLVIDTYLCKIVRTRKKVRQDIVGYASTPAEAREKVIALRETAIEGDFYFYDKA